MESNMTDANKHSNSSNENHQKDAYPKQSVVVNSNQGFPSVIRGVRPVRSSELTSSPIRVLTPNIPSSPRFILVNNSTLNGNQVVLSCASSQPNITSGFNPAFNTIVQNIRSKPPETLSKAASIPASQLMLLSGNTSKSGTFANVQQGMTAGQQSQVFFRLPNGSFQPMMIPTPTLQRLTSAGPKVLSPSPRFPTSSTTPSSVALRPKIVPNNESAMMKCRNFIENILVTIKDKTTYVDEEKANSLIQSFVDGSVSTQSFCLELERLLNAQPQPNLVQFFERHMPALREALVRKEFTIEGIRPPKPTPTAPTTHSILRNIQPMITTVSGKAPPIKILSQKVITPGNSKPSSPAPYSPSSSALTSNPMSTGTTTVIKMKSTSNNLSKGKANPKVVQKEEAGVNVDKMTEFEDLNDVAAMGGVNIEEESERNIDTQAIERSCKDRLVADPIILRKRLEDLLASKGCFSQSPSNDVIAILSHAMEMRVKHFIEKLSVIADHRVDFRNNPCYEATNDVKAKLRFLASVEEAQSKKLKEAEMELLLRAVKSRAKDTDGAISELKAKAKEMQLSSMEETRFKDTNLTALDAIGGPRKKFKFDDKAETQSPTSSQVSAPVIRRKRCSVRDLMFVLEDERDPRSKTLLFKLYNS